MSSILRVPKLRDPVWPRVLAQNGSAVWSSDLLGGSFFSVDVITNALGGEVAPDRR